MKKFAVFFLISWVAGAMAADADETPVYDTKFVCDAQFKSGDQIQVTGFFYAGAEIGAFENKAWKVDHIYINGERKLDDEEYNRVPEALYFRALELKGNQITPSIFALKTINDGAMDHLVIEYLGKNHPSNTLFLMGWSGAKDNSPDIQETGHVARASKVQCRFSYLLGE